MAIRALDLVAKASSRFVYEILPVAMASVIGAMLVNHYGRQPAAVLRLSFRRSRRPPKTRWCNRCATTTNSLPAL